MALLAITRPVSVERTNMRRRRYIDDVQATKTGKAFELFSSSGTKRTWWRCQRFSPFNMQQNQICSDGNFILFWRRRYNDVLRSTLHRFNVASPPALRRFFISPFWLCNCNYWEERSCSSGFWVLVIWVIPDFQCNSLSFLFLVLS